MTSSACYDVFNQWTVCTAACSGLQQRKHKGPHYWPLVGANRRLKGPAMRWMFSMSSHHHACCPTNHTSLQWRHNVRDGVSNNQPYDYLRNRLFKARIKENIKTTPTGVCEGNSPVTCEFPAQRASNAETVSIWWRHHVSTSSPMNKILGWNFFHRNYLRYPSIA